MLTYSMIYVLSSSRRKAIAVGFAAFSPEKVLPIVESSLNGGHRVFVGGSRIATVNSQDIPPSIRLKGLIDSRGGLRSDADDEVVLLGRQR